MIRKRRRFRGFAMLEAMGAACILALVLGSLVLLLTISASARQHALLRTQLRERLNIHLIEMQGVIGASPDCSVQLEEIRQEQLQDRDYQFKRSVQPYSWVGLGEPPAMLQLTAAAATNDGTQLHPDIVFTLSPCSRTGQ